MPRGAGYLLVLAALALACLPAGIASASRAYSYFAHTSVVSSDDLSAFTKWTALEPRYEREKATAESDCVEGKRCLPREWEALLKKLEGEPVAKQMQAVNDFFNAIPYVEDIDNYGVQDYWATPYEFMARGGDCEDYAIAKYFSLRRLGVPARDMRVVIVQDWNLNGEMHAVLEVKQKGTAYLLDNQAARVIAESNIYHYQPLYAINEQNWWAYQSN